MGYKNKNQIKEELVGRGFSPEEIDGMSRKELHDLLKNGRGSAEVEPQADLPPDMTDPGWTDYVMTHFSNSELRDGMPTCDGLRRVFRLLVGKIVSVEMRVIKAPNLQDPSATVSCAMVYILNCKDCRGNYQISDVFDVNP